MSIKKISSNIGTLLINSFGWHTNKKIVIFESDDWGSMRMPSSKTYETLVKKNVIIPDNDHFYKYDTLESNNDLTGLFEVLISFKDHKGNHPVFTAVNVVANPDFKKIKDANFEEYFYEPFTELAARLKNKEYILDLWLEGEKSKIFEPQFHGREHLNVKAWMRALKSDQPKTKMAFEHGVYGINSIKLGESKVHYLASFDVEEKEDIGYQQSSITDGIELFRSLVRYSPTFFVPSNGPFNLLLEETLSENGIKYLMLNKFQKEPQGNEKYKYRIRFLGSQNKNKQIYLSRNVSFEPSAIGRDWIDYTLKQMEHAFKYNVPATIGTHRVNYIGGLYPENRDNGLNLLKILLTRILSTWPDVEFMTSSELGELIKSTRKY